MKYKIKIAILSFFTLFLSLFNLKNGLIFNVTDNTERDALYTNLQEKTDTKDQIKSDLKSVNIPKSTVKKATTYAVSSATTKKASTPKNYDYTKISSSRINCNTSMPVANGINYCNYRGSSAIFAYGHNKSNVFASLANIKQNDTFTIKIDGKVRKFRVINNFTLKLSTLQGSEASALRTKLYNSTYGGKFDITLQTCAGANDSYRRYVQAIEV